MRTLFVFFSIFGLFLINSSSGQELTTKGIEIFNQKSKVKQIEIALGQKSQCEIECSGPNTVCIDFGSQVLCLSFLFISVFSITLYFIFVLVITMVCCCVKRRRRQRRRAEKREQQNQVVQAPKHSSIDLLAPKMKPSVDSSQNPVDQRRNIPNVIVLNFGSLREQCELDSEISFDPAEVQQSEVVVVRESFEKSIENTDTLETRSEIYPVERHSSDDRAYNTLGRVDLSKFSAASDQRPSSSNRVMTENDSIRVNELFRHIQNRDRINSTS